MGMSIGRSSSTKSPVDSYLCVYVMEALLEVIKEARPEMCVSASKIKGGFGCVMYRCLSSSISCTATYVCVYICMLPPLNDCNYIRQIFCC